jgi:hypothetical protein
MRRRKGDSGLGWGLGRERELTAEDTDNLDLAKKQIHKNCVICG